MLGKGAGEARRAEAAEQIRAATRALLAGGESFANLSVERIAAGAGISRTAFYVHFRDKRDLLMRLVEEAAAPIVQEADELVGGRPSGPSEIPYTIRAAMRFARDSREVFRATVEAAAYDPVIAEFWRDGLLGRFVDAIERRIRRQQDAGAALPMPPRPAARALILMVTGTLYEHVGSEDPSADDELVDTLTTIAVRAVYGPQP